MTLSSSSKVDDHLLSIFCFTSQTVNKIHIMKLLKGHILTKEQFLVTYVNYNGGLSKLLDFSNLHFHFSNAQTNMRGDLHLFHFSYHFINKEQTSIEKKMILQKLELLSRVVDNIFWNENADNLKN